MDFENIIVYGTGSIGSVIATFLKLSSDKTKYKVHLIGRKNVLGEIESNGLTYVPFDDKKPNITTTGFILHENIKEVKKADVIFITLKAHGLESALRDAKHLLDQDPFVFLSMNGLGLPEIAEKYVPKQNIIECVVNYPSNLQGSIVKNDGGNSNFLVKKTNVPPINDIIHSLFLPNTLDIRVDENFKLNQWKKAIMNIGMNGISAITMLTVGEVLERKTLGSIIKQLIKEAMLIAEKEGIVFNENMVEFFWRFAGRDPDHTTSTYQDIIKGRKTEVEFMNGFIVKMGERYGISTPANQSINLLMKIIENYKD